MKLKKGVIVKVGNKTFKDEIPDNLMPKSLSKSEEIKKSDDNKKK